VSAHFSFDESLEAKLVAELNDTATRAAGRPTEIDMMIFEFQSNEIQKAITDIAKSNPNVTFRVIADSTPSVADRRQRAPGDPQGEAAPTCR